MKFKLIVFCLVPIITLTGIQANKNQDYIKYHQQITDAERLISEEKFGNALIRYEQVLKSLTNLKRKNIGLRSIELRNKLIDVEIKTGINLYLPDWIDGKIQVKQK